MVSVIGSVTKSPVRKIFLRRRLIFFITLNPLKSFVVFNFIRQSSARVTKDFFIVLYIDVLGRQAAVRICFHQGKIVIWNIFALLISAYFVDYSKKVIGKIKLSFGGVFYVDWSATWRTVFFQPPTYKVFMGNNIAHRIKL